MLHISKNLYLTKQLFTNAISNFAFIFALMLVLLGKWLLSYGFNTCCLLGTCFTSFVVVQFVNLTILQMRSIYLTGSGASIMRCICSIAFSLLVVIVVYNFNSYFVLFSGLLLDTLFNMIYLSTSLVNGSILLMDNLPQSGNPGNNGSTGNNRPSGGSSPSGSSSSGGSSSGSSSGGSSPSGGPSPGHGPSPSPGPGPGGNGGPSGNYVFVNYNADNVHSISSTSNNNDNRSDDFSAEETMPANAVAPYLAGYFDRELNKVLALRGGHADRSSVTLFQLGFTKANYVRCMMDRYPYITEQYAVRQFERSKQVFTQYIEDNRNIHPDIYAKLTANAAGGSWGDVPISTRLNRWDVINGLRNYRGR